MVPVAQHHGGQILFMPLREVLKVALVSGRVDSVPRGPLVLGVFPIRQRPRPSSGSPVCRTGRTAPAYEGCGWCGWRCSPSPSGESRRLSHTSRVTAAPRQPASWWTHTPFSFMLRPFRKKPSSGSKRKERMPTGPSYTLVRGRSRPRKAPSPACTTRPAFRETTAGAPATLPLQDHRFRPAGLQIHDGSSPRAPFLPVGAVRAAGDRRPLPVLPVSLIQLMR